jgi:hypothetical protein
MRVCLGPIIFFGILGHFQAILKILLQFAVAHIYNRNLIQQYKFLVSDAKTYFV